MKLLLEERRTFMDVAGKWLLRIVAALLFISVGANKFEAHTMWVELFDKIGFGQWFRYFTGALQVLGGVLILIPRTFPLGILLVACTMAGAMAAWIFLLGSPLSAVIPGALLGGLVAIGGEELIDLLHSVAFRRLRP